MTKLPGSKPVANGRKSVRRTLRRPAANQVPPTVVQDVAWALKGAVKGSLTALSKASGITLDALRVAKRSPGTKGARQLSPPRARMLALLLAAHRDGVLGGLLRTAADIEAEWRTRFPGALAD